MSWKWKEYPDGTRYRVYSTICDYCKEVAWKRRCDINNKNVFCNYECSRLFKFNGRMFKCYTCGKETYRSKSEEAKSISGDIFCSKTCATVTNNNRYKIGKNHPNWKGGQYRAKALAYYGAKCQNSWCPLKHNIVIETKMLDVHHKDGNRKNNKLENLEVLCVWCHALETRRDW